MPQPGKSSQAQERMCKYCRTKSQCKDRRGASLCQHRRQRSKRKDCGGASLCRLFDFSPSIGAVRFRFEVLAFSCELSVLSVLSTLVYILIQVHQVSAVWLQLTSDFTPHRRKHGCLHNDHYASVGYSFTKPRVSAALGLALDATPYAPSAGLRPWWCVAGTQGALQPRPAAVSQVSLGLSSCDFSL